jgi:hypothetical protein
MCHGLRSYHSQRAFLVYHDPCRHLGLVAAQRQADQGDAVRQGLHHRPVATLRHEGGPMRGTPAHAGHMRSRPRVVGGEPCSLQSSNASPSCIRTRRQQFAQGSGTG